MHPRVAFAWRQNVGMMVQGQRKIRFSFVGCSDILGALTDGRFLAIETKASGKHATDEQQAFLDAVTLAGGAALCVDDPQALIEWLEIC